ncbi:DUF2268 domain-containing putative Zn-dependent protease [Oceanobacillus manasiensis]|uniref:DUF2268 domain-containing putative Zn-dependent protease n=1 Tax=Oceanobacillus manasiensis TaxID=586413 RepID=UPI0006945CCD|nr:DUF2268 domain-containing putative Zn-dependent protease [Oceanobacillus manasiensis]
MRLIVVSIAFLLVFLSGCKEDEVKDIVTEFTHPDMDQSFQIVSAYKLYDAFIEKALQESEEENVESLFETMVIEPVHEQCVAEGEHAEAMDLVWEQTPPDLENAKGLIKEIDTESINIAIKDALIKSSTLLPSEIENTVCVFPALGEESPVGFNVGAGKILLFHSSYLKEDDYKITTAHEYHHSVWTEKYYDPNDYITVLENMVFEGKALVFEELVYPEMYSYSIPVYSTYNNNHWELIEADLNQGNLERSLEILYGEGELPPFYGYSEGFKIVMNYLEQYPDLEPEEWLGIDGEKMFEEGNYLSNYE